MFGTWFERGGDRDRAYVRGDNPNEGDRHDGNGNRRHRAKERAPLHGQWIAEIGQIKKA